MNYTKREDKKRETVFQNLSVFFFRVLMFLLMTSASHTALCSGRSKDGNLSDDAAVASARPIPAAAAADDDAASAQSDAASAQEDDSERDWRNWGDISDDEDEGRNTSPARDTQSTFSLGSPRTQEARKTFFTDFMTAFLREDRSQQVTWQRNFVSILVSHTAPSSTFERDSDLCLPSPFQNAAFLGTLNRIHSDIERQLAPPYAAPFLVF